MSGLGNTSPRIRKMFEDLQSERDLLKAELEEVKMHEFLDMGELQKVIEKRDAYRAAAEGLADSLKEAIAIADWKPNKWNQALAAWEKVRP